MVRARQKHRDQDPDRSFPSLTPPLTGFRGINRDDETTLTASCVISSRRGKNVPDQGPRPPAAASMAARCAGQDEPFHIQCGSHRSRARADSSEAEDPLDGFRSRCIDLELFPGSAESIGNIPTRKQAPPHAFLASFQSRSMMSFRFSSAIASRICLIRTSFRSLPLYVGMPAIRISTPSFANSWKRVSAIRTSPYRTAAPRALAARQRPSRLGLGCRSRTLAASARGSRRDSMPPPGGRIS